MTDSHVIDASVAVRVFFQEGDSTALGSAVGASEWRIAPDLIFLEFANAAWKKVTKKLVSPAAARDAVVSLEALIDEVVPARDLYVPSFDLAVRLGFTAYDASYLVLAELRGCRVLTADAKLAVRAEANGLSELVQFIS